MRGGERETERGRSWQSRQFVQKLRSRKRERERETRVAESQITRGQDGLDVSEPDLTGGEDGKDNGKFLEACKQRGTWPELGFLSSSR